VYYLWAIGVLIILDFGQDNHRYARLGFGVARIVRKLLCLDNIDLSFLAVGLARGKVVAAVLFDSLRRRC
jgi:hypothetical protein